MQMYTFVWYSVAILETPSKKTAVILSHLYVIGLKIVLRDECFTGNEFSYYENGTFQYILSTPVKKN